MKRNGMPVTSENVSSAAELGRIKRKEKILN
jgi:hypothetical protein